MRLPNFRQPAAAKTAGPVPVLPVNNTRPAVLTTKEVSETAGVQDLIAPPFIEVDFNHVKIGDLYHRTLFVADYPRYVFPNWLAPIINFDHSLDISLFIYPVESKDTLSNLKRKIAEMEATIESDIKRGKVIDPGVQVALDDALVMQEQLAKGSERFFQFAPYFTINSYSLDDLERTTKEVQSALAALSITAKKTTLQMEDGFKATLPLCVDKLMITRNMDTTSLATTFPFTSSELTANEGVLYGINEHNDSLVIFDRFSLENANSLIMGKSGSGKSYLVKIEALRSLMFGTDVIIVDPEEEYKKLCEAVGGEYISFSFSSMAHINPFDLSGTNDDPQENDLQQKINMTLTRLLKIMVGTQSAEEDAIIHNALEMTYAQKGITYDPATHTKEPPLLEDLYKVLVGMETERAQNLALRMEKFVKGSFGGIFNQRSTVNLKNPFTIFSFKNLEDQLRNIAIFIIVDYIRNQVKTNFKKRILIVDEAWYLMKNPSSAEFLWDFAKRARKYYLGLTTITQDIEDFLATDLGKTIITNSSIQILMKQSPAAIEKLAQVFLLSEGEKQFLLAANIGECIFFAGSSHVAMQAVASPDEHTLITSNPQEILARTLKEQAAEADKIKMTALPAEEIPYVAPQNGSVPTTPSVQTPKSFESIIPPAEPQIGTTPAQTTPFESLYTPEEAPIMPFKEVPPESSSGSSSSPSLSTTIETETKADTNVPAGPVPSFFAPPNDSFNSSPLPSTVDSSTNPQPQVRVEVTPEEKASPGS